MPRSAIVACTAGGLPGPARAALWQRWRRGAACRSRAAGPGAQPVPPAALAGYSDRDRDAGAGPASGSQDSDALLRPSPGP